MYEVAKVPAKVGAAMRDRRFPHSGFLFGARVLGLSLLVAHQAQAQVDPADLAFNSRVTLTWDAPTERENGVHLPADELSQFSIYIQDAAALGARMVVPVDPGLRSFTLDYSVFVEAADVLDDGRTRVAVAMTAMDLEGRQSKQSVTLVKQIPVPQEVLDMLDRLGEGQPGQPTNPVLVAPGAVQNLTADFVV